jgi:hypothetical protein
MNIFREWFQRIVMEISIFLLNKCFLKDVYELNVIMYYLYPSYLVPNAIRICKKIGIDFAPAMVGWDYRLGRPIPKLEGIVICEEHEDLLYDVRSFVYC